MSPSKDKDESATSKDEVKDVIPDDGENEAKTSEKTAVSTDDKTAADSLNDKSAADSKDDSETADKITKDDTEIKETEEEKATPKKPAKTVQVEEYLVKFKNFSYLHCQWLTEAELLKGDKRVSNKVSRLPHSSIDAIYV